MTDRLRVGTRRSPLARAQTEEVVRRLARSAPRAQFETVPIETSGDRDRSLGGSPDFTDAIDRALLRGEIDLAVHSAKDLPVTLDPRLQLGACPPRADPRDALVVAPGVAPDPLPSGARVGSSSLRRRAQLLRHRPDLAVVEVRGNVDTRLALVRSGALEAAVLAVAGLARLGRREEAARTLPVTEFVPAPAQGSIAVVQRADDRQVRAIVRRVDHGPTRSCVLAERAFAAALGGDCRMPLGALATARDQSLTLRGQVLSPDGRRSLRVRGSGPLARPIALGERLGRAMLGRGAEELLRPAAR